MAIYTVANTGLIIYGDGVSTVFTYDLSNYPFGIPFNGSFPDEVVLTALSVELPDGSGPDPTYNATVSMHRSTITLTFNKPLLAETPPPPISGVNAASVTLQFVYKSQ